MVGGSDRNDKVKKKEKKKEGFEGISDCLWAERSKMEGLQEQPVMYIYLFTCKARKEGRR